MSKSLSSIIFNFTRLMSHTFPMCAPCSKLRKKAQRAILENALFRWENAVVLGGTIALTALWPHPFPRWPRWGWPFLGLLGIGGLVYSSLTDNKANTRLLLELFQNQCDLQKIQDKGLRHQVETAIEYQQSIEARRYSQRPGILRDRLGDTIDQLSDWIINIYKLALKLDTHRRDGLLSREREMVPQEIKILKDRYKGESDSIIQKKLGELLESKEKQWQSLQALDNRMKQAALQLEQSITALATIHSQMQLIDARDVDSGRTDRLTTGIQEQIHQLNDLIGSINKISKRIAEEEKL